LTLNILTLNILNFQLTWIGDFVAESGWAEEVVKTLAKVRKDCLESSVLSAYEDLLCSLIKSNGNVISQGSILQKLHFGQKLFA
jgi:hypothetical protein